MIFILLVTKHVGSVSSGYSVRIVRFLVGSVQHNLTELAQNKAWYGSVQYSVSSVLIIQLKILILVSCWFT